MAKAKKLKSGAWRTLVFSHFEIIDGKKQRVYESFTSPDKKESEYMAAEFAREKKKITPREHDRWRSYYGYKKQRGILSPIYYKKIIIKYRNYNVLLFDQQN